MASSSAEATEAASSISKLTIDPTKKTPAAKSKGRKSKQEVVDSWEDDDISSGSENGDSQPSTASQGVKAGTSAPPPTPISPNYSVSQAFSSPMIASLSPDADSGSASRRPEKTDAVARRMIASALGVKVPKQTEEQKVYDKAMRENERKRRDQERAADKRKLEEAELAKKAVWED